MPSNLDQDRVILLGTKGGPRVAKGSSWPTSSAIVIAGKLFVIDAGLGVTRQFVEAGLDFADLETILITHHHSDHTLELGGLLHTMWTSSAPKKRWVYGPEGLDTHMKGFLQAQSFDIGIRVADEKQTDLNHLLEWHEFYEGTVFEDATVKVSALRVEHPPVHHCYALKFESPGKTVVFGADTAFFPPLAEFAKGANLLIHEAMHSAGAKHICQQLKAIKPNLWHHFVSSHTPCEDVGRIASSAGVKHLLLNHFVPDIGPLASAEDYKTGVSSTYSGPITVGSDLIEVAF